MTGSEGDVRVDQIERRSWILAVILLVASFAWRSPEVSAGVALGALLVILSFRWLRRLVSSFVAPRRQRPPRLLAILNLTKYLIMGVAIFLAIKYDFANAIALLAGVSVIFLAVCWEGICAHRRTREGADHAAEF